MATVIQGRNPYQGLINLGRGAIQGYDKVSRRKGLLEGLTPEQKAIGQDIPLQQLEALVSNMAQQGAFKRQLTPVEIAQQDNKLNIATLKGLYLDQTATEDQTAMLRSLGILQPEPNPVAPSKFAEIYKALKTPEAQAAFLARQAGSMADVVAEKTPEKSAFSQLLDQITDPVEKKRAIDIEAMLIAGDATSSDKTEFEKLLAKLPLTLQNKALMIKLGLEPKAGTKSDGKSNLTKITYNIDTLKAAQGGGQGLFPVDYSSWVPNDKLERAQELANRGYGISPSSITNKHFLNIENLEGFNDATKLEHKDVLPTVVPLLVEASFIKNINPVKAIEDFFEDWSTRKVKSKTLSIWGDTPTRVDFTKISELPSEAVRNSVILEYVGGLLENLSDQRLQDRYKRAYRVTTPDAILKGLSDLRGRLMDASASKDPELIKEAVKDLRLLFGGRKTRNN